MNEQTKCADCGSVDLRLTDLVVRSHKVVGIKHGRLVLEKLGTSEEGEKPMIHCFECGGDWREEIWESDAVAEALESGF